MITIETAAIRAEDGITVYTVPRPGRHPSVRDFMRFLGYTGSIHDQGFLTSDGRFVDRLEGAAIALAAGQIPELNWPPNLYSEDLWQGGYYQPGQKWIISGSQPTQGTELNNLTQTYHDPIMGSMKRISAKFTLDQDLMDWVRQEAGRRHCSMSQILRDLIVEKMSK